MNTAIGLLMAAMQLLAIVQANPQLPQDFRDRATDTANYAITYAQAQLAQSGTPTPSDTIISITPSVVGSAPIMEPISKAAVVVTQTGTQPVDELNGMPFGAFSFSVQVLSADGKAIKDAPVTLEAAYNLYGQEVKTANGQTSQGSGDWSAGFQYVPTRGGHRVLTFTSGSLSTTVALDI